MWILSVVTRCACVLLTPLFLVATKNWGQPLATPSERDTTIVRTVMNLTHWYDAQLTQMPSAFTRRGNCPEALTKCGQGEPVLLMKWLDGSSQTPTSLLASV